MLFCAAGQQQHQQLQQSSPSVEDIGRDVALLKRLCGTLQQQVATQQALIDKLLLAQQATDATLAQLRPTTTSVSPSAAAPLAGAAVLASTEPALSLTPSALSDESNAESAPRTVCDECHQSPVVYVCANVPNFGIYFFCNHSAIVKLPSGVTAFCCKPCAIELQRKMQEAKVPVQEHVRDSRSGNKPPQRAPPDATIAKPNRPPTQPHAAPFRKVSKARTVVPSAEPPSAEPPSAEPPLRAPPMAPVDDSDSSTHDEEEDEEAEAEEEPDALPPLPSEPMNDVQEQAARRPRLCVCNRTLKIARHCGNAPTCRGGETRVRDATRERAARTRGGQARGRATT